MKNGARWAAARSSSLIALLGASVALAGLSGCTRAPREAIVPYVSQPPEVTPGVPRFYATTMDLDGRAMGLVVESHEGRPTKVEPNESHPSSGGGTSARTPSGSAVARSVSVSVLTSDWML